MVQIFPRNSSFDVIHRPVCRFIPPAHRLCLSRILRHRPWLPCSNLARFGLPFGLFQRAKRSVSQRETACLAPPFAPFCASACQNRLFNMARRQAGHQGEQQPHLTPLDKIFLLESTPFRIFICNFTLGLGSGPIRDIVKKAFAIISRLAKSVGNSFGITSTEIIRDRRLASIRLVWGGLLVYQVKQCIHATGVVHSYGRLGAPSDAAPC